MQNPKLINNSSYEFCSVEPCVYYDRLSSFLKESELTLKQFGYQKEHIKKCGPRIYGDLELIYVLSGECFITVDGTEYNGFSGDMFVIPKYSICSISSTDEFENYWMHIDIKDMFAAEQIKHLLGGPLIHLGKDKLLLEFYRKLEDYYTNQCSGSYLGIHCLMQLIFLRLNELAENRNLNTVYFKAGKNSRKSQILQEAIQLITLHHGTVTVEYVSSKLYISTAYLRKIFSELLGISPLEFIRTVRMRQAEILLLTTTETVSAISERLNFSSQFHFCNEFCKYHSVSPNKYRTIGFSEL